MEDIIEEIVGEINDEYDEEERTYVKLTENVYVFEGKTLLSDFIRLSRIVRRYLKMFLGCGFTGWPLLELKGEFPHCMRLSITRITALRFWR